MKINLRVMTPDALVHDFSVDNEITVREFKLHVAIKTHINPAQQIISFWGLVLADDSQLKDIDFDGNTLNVAKGSLPLTNCAYMSYLDGVLSSSLHRLRHEIEYGLRRKQQQMEALVRDLAYLQQQRDLSQGRDAARPPNDDDSSDAGPHDT